MKNLLIFTTTILFWSCTQQIDINQDHHIPINHYKTKSVDNDINYYWYNGEKYYLTVKQNKYFALLSSSIKSEDLNSSVSLLSNLDLNRSQSSLDTTSLDDENYLPAVVNSDVLSAYSSYIKYYAPYFITSDGNEVGLSNITYVKLHSQDDYDILEKFAANMNVDIVGPASLPLWYILSCNISSHVNALELANIAIESGIFASSYAGFIDSYRIFSNDELYNDQYYYLQWNINGNNEYGINIEKVHEITTGNNSIIVAIIDAGVNLSHPDLNILYSWDAVSSTSPARYYHSSHGNETTGLISAIINNNLGISGIAPNIQPLPISVDFNNIYVDNYLVDAINFAVEYGADVLNMSWGGIINNQYLYEAVNNAILNGRNGKGCILVQAMGNDEQENAIVYPYSSFPQIITVGATDNSGLRASFSNYGANLDVVAPGKDIIVLDAINDCDVKSGTSYACPHVASTAALMLSVNPELTTSEVSTIIERTAYKLPNYEFSVTSSRPNGIWNNKVGYGLVNTLAAVKLAKHFTIDDYISVLYFVSTDSTVELSVTTSENLAVVWDLEAKDVSYVFVEDTLTTKTLTHTYTDNNNHRIYIADLIEENETFNYSTALKEFRLISGEFAKDIIFDSNNCDSLRYITIDGGEQFAEQNISFAGLEGLEEVYLKKMNNTSVNIVNCPSLKVFSTSQSILNPPSINPISQSSIITEDKIDPNIVIGEGATPNLAWPAIPEPNITISSFNISNCPKLETLSLENVGIYSINFESFPNLKYLYLSSKVGKIITAPNNLNTLNKDGEALSSAISSLPVISENSNGNILLRCINDSSSAYTAIPLRQLYYNAIQTSATNKNWNISYLTGITLL